MLARRVEPRCQGAARLSAEVQGMDDSLAVSDGMVEDHPVPMQGNRQGREVITFVGVSTEGVAFGGLLEIRREVGERVANQGDIAHLGITIEVSDELRRIVPGQCQQAAHVGSGSFERAFSEDRRALAGVGQARQAQTVDGQPRVALQTIVAAA